MMLSHLKKFKLGPNENIIVKVKPNDLTYMITLLWGIENGSIGLENEEDGL
jgi:hypothetical protein